MLAIRYKGRLVKRMQRGPQGIQLRFYSATPGTRGDKLNVSQEDWDRHGSKTTEPGTPSEVRAREALVR